MARLGAILWLCFGAFGLGLILLEASRRKRPIRSTWFLLALALGPIFLCFILPLWLGRWGKETNRINRQDNIHN